MVPLLYSRISILGFLFLNQLQEHDLRAIALARPNFEHPGIAARAAAKTRRNIIEKLLYSLCVAQASCSQAAGVDRIDITSFVPALSHCDQALGLSAHSLSFGARSANALVLEQLLDQYPPQSSAFILAAA
jgi:hypothetical protein